MRCVGVMSVLFEEFVIVFKSMFFDFSEVVVCVMFEV